MPNQFKYQKVDGTPSRRGIEENYIFNGGAWTRLGLKKRLLTKLVAKGHFDVVDVLGKRRVTKESFERWYASQTVTAR